MIEKIEEFEANYKNICLELSGYISGTSKKASDDEIALFVDMLSTERKRISFEDLDNYYEKGIGENISTLPDELWPLVIGISLLDRYGLSKDEYTAWAEKIESPEIVYLMLRMIGEERPDLIKRIKENEKMEKKAKLEPEYVGDDVKEHYDNMMRILKKYPKLINLDKNGEYKFLNQRLGVPDTTKRVAKIISNKNRILEFGKEVFYRGVNRSCTTYELCSNNISLVLNDSLDAMWVKFKRVLSLEGIQQEEIVVLRETYINNSRIYIKSVKCELDKIYAELYEELIETANELDQNYSERINSINFTGGGLGIGGAITGMIGASIATKFAESIVRTRTIKDGRKVVTSFKDLAREIYLGEETQSLYIKILETSLVDLLEQTSKKIMGVELASMSNDFEAIETLKAVNRELSDDLLGKMSLELLCRFPFERTTWHFLFDNYMNIFDDLFLIKNELFIPDDIFNVENTWDFVVSETKKVLSYKAAYKLYLKEKEQCFFDYASKVSRDKMVNRLVFRIRVKAISEKLGLVNNSINKYAWECKDLPLYKYIEEEQKDKAYVLLSGKFFLLSDIGLIVVDESGEVFSYELKKIEELIVVGPCYPGDSRWIVIRHNKGKRELVKIENRMSDVALALAAVVNVSLNIQYGEEDKREFRKIQKTAGKKYYCDKCGYIGIPYDSGLFFSGLQCHSCYEKSLFLYGVVIDKDIVELDSNVNDYIKETSLSKLYEDEILVYETVKDSTNLFLYADGEANIKEFSGKDRKRKQTEKATNIENDYSQIEQILRKKILGTKWEKYGVYKELKEIENLELREQLKFQIQNFPNQYVFYFNPMVYISDKFFAWDFIFFPLEDFEEIVWEDNPKDPKLPVFVKLKNGKKYRLNDAGHDKVMAEAMNESIGMLKRLERKSQSKINKIYCRYCGKQISKDVKFCNFCGEQK